MLEDPDDAIGPYLLALASALPFASILLHELGTRSSRSGAGIGIDGITLWMFGGVAVLSRDSDSPGTEFKIAIAGPLVTAAIVVVCVGAGIGLAGAEDFRDAATIEEQTRTSGIAAMIAWLASINLLVLIFNLVPAFPLDGGSIARAIASVADRKPQQGDSLRSDVGPRLRLHPDRRRRLPLHPR